MKKISAVLLLLSISFAAIADEGMWLVNLLEKQSYSIMKKKGLKLKANEIYSQESTSIKDAIVALDHGMCTGSIISHEGLMITNHHCAYGDVHALSTPVKNYLEDGFWALNRESEIPVKGKTVTFLRKVEDVTDQVNKIIDSLDKAGPRGIFFMRKVSSIIENIYKNQPYELDLSSMWRGSKYYLFFYETFSDVRLVGAPPVSIGAYGGETDNWGWPQHKGDFAIYRVYTGKDGKPAEYSKDNIPLQAKRYLTISSKGVGKDDFTMIMGYPGSTNRYSSSYELQEKYDILNPIVSGVRRAKLEVWKKYMDSDTLVRLKYADKYFGISNYTDYAKWENICITKFSIIDSLKSIENDLKKWISEDPARAKKYGDVFEKLEKGYQVKGEITRIKEYFRESMIRGSEFLNLGQRYNSLAGVLTKAKKENFSMLDKEVSDFVKGFATKIYENSDVNADKELLKVMLTYFIKEVPSKFYEDDFVKLLDSLNRNPEAIANYIFANSNITDSLRMRTFFNSTRNVSQIYSDPIIKIVKSLGIRPYNSIEDSLLKINKIDLSSERGKYARALYEMKLQRGIPTYPDANSTMRITYGEVGAVSPSDGIYYHYQSTSDGILQKYNPKDYEFKLKSDYKDLLRSKDWGRWGQDSKLYVNFLTDNDITGGNSGSPVMNAKGELIGLAFDGNRESMAGDVYYKDGMNKCVNVDIRYVLWVVDKYAKSEYILKELNIK